MRGRGREKIIPGALRIGAPLDNLLTMKVFFTQPGERGVFFLSLAGLFILAGYEVVRPVSSSLYLAEFGAARLPYALALVPLAVTAATWFYSAVLARLGPARTFLYSLIGSAAVLWLCRQLAGRGVAYTSLIFYLFGQIYIVLLLAQIWSLINSTLALEQARRLNGPIIGVASIGSIGGGLLTGRLARSWGSEATIALAAVFTLTAAAIGWIAFRRCGEPRPPRLEKPGTDHFALAVFRQERRLIWLALIVAAAQVLSTLLDVAFHQAVELAIPDKDLRSSFLGYFWSGVNAAAAVLQFAACPLLMRAVALRKLHFSLPALHLAAVLLFAVQPALWTAGAAFFLFKAFDYSLFGAIKEVLYLPFSFAARYRAKAVIDAVVYRGSKGLTSAALSLITAAAGAVPMRLLGAAAAGAALGWLLLVQRLLRREVKPPLAQNSILQEILR